MHLSALLILLAGLTGSAAPMVETQLDQMLTVRAFRFYRAEGRETLVTGVIEIPYRLLATTAARPNRRSGTVLITVSDSAGLELHRSGWPVSVTSKMTDSTAALMELIEFKLMAGRYQLTVTVEDSATGKSVTRSLPITGFAGPPPASDVVLSPSIRQPGWADGDTALAPGERRWGGLVLVPAARLQLTPVRAHAFYLIEVYPGRDTVVTMTARVLDGDDRAVVTTRPRQALVAQAGSVLRGQVDLTGLPSGHYRLSVVLQRDGRVEERSDSFTMGDFQDALNREEVRLATLRQTDVGYFGSLNDEQLEAAAGPLIYLTSRDSLSVLKSGLSLKARREFLIRFWHSRDPTPGGGRNEAREGFYQRIAEADRSYGERGRTATPGWRTDRGRIAILQGEPSERLDRRTSAGTAPPYEVWRYQRGKARYYVFADRTGFGNYRLIVSNDLKEGGTPGFRELLGGEALQDISRWLGTDLFADQSGRSAN